MTRPALPRILAALLVLSGAGCKTGLEDRFDEPDTNPVRRLLKLTMPLAYTANLTMAALHGRVARNVHIVDPGVEGLTPFLLEITVDDAFPLPQGVEATGIVAVAGLVARDSFGDPDFVLMTVAFGELNVVRGSFLVQDVTAMPVVVDHDLESGEERVYAVYANVDVDLGSGADPRGSLSLTQEQIDERYERYEKMRQFDYDQKTTLVEDTWILTVDDNDTLHDAADDTYWVGGAEQYVEAGTSAQLMQMFLLLAMEPSCKMNPMEGGGFIQNVTSGEDSLEVGQVALGVTGECDGKMRFLAGTGSYILLIDKPFPLHLDEE